MRLIMDPLRSLLLSARAAGNSWGGVSSRGTLTSVTRFFFGVIFANRRVRVLSGFAAVVASMFTRFTTAPAARYSYSTTQIIHCLHRKKRVPITLGLIINNFFECLSMSLEVA